MGKSSFFGDGNIHRESTLVLYSASTRLTDGGRIMVRTAAFVLGSQMTTSDPTMLACLSIRSSPVPSVAGQWQTPEGRVHSNFPLWPG